MVDKRKSFSNLRAETIRKKNLAKKRLFAASTDEYRQAHALGRHIRNTTKPISILEAEGWSKKDEAKYVDKIYKDFPRMSKITKRGRIGSVIGLEKYDMLAKQGFFDKPLTKKALKTLFKIGLAGVTGPAGLLAAGISEAAAATPAGAGEDELLYEMRRKKVPGGGPDEAYFKRQKSGSIKEKKKGGGKIKKNYAKGGGVRPTSY